MNQVRPSFPRVVRRSPGGHISITCSSTRRCWARARGAAVLDHVAVDHRPTFDRSDDRQVPQLHPFR
eukprot:7948645-Pyramimonas_sp.AAC.1